MFYGKIAKLTFSALLLAAAGSAYAQDVTLNDGTTKVSWSEFINAINDPKSITGTADDTELKAKEKAHEEAKLLLQSAETEYNNWEENLRGWKEQRDYLSGQLTSLNADLAKANAETTMVPSKWLETANSNAEAFSIAYSDQTNDKYIYYKITESGSGARLLRTLTLSFNISDTEATSLGYTKVNQEQYYELIDGESAKKINSVKVFFGKNSEGQNNYTISSTGDKTTGYKYSASDEFRSSIMLDAAKETIEGLYSNSMCTEPKNAAERKRLSDSITATQNQLNDYSKKISDYSITPEEGTQITMQTRLKNAYEDARTKELNAKSELDTAQNEYDNAVADSLADAQANYQTVYLNGDVTTSETIKGMFSGEIFGNGHVINIEGTDPFCRTFNGQMANVAVNGKIFSAQGANASYTNVAYWDGSNGAFRDDDNNRTTCDTLGKLGFAARSAFGVDFSGNKLVTLTDESKVYSITEYQANSTTQQYVQTRDGNGFFTESKQTYSIPANVFVESATADLTGYDNVIIDGKCENVVIADKTAFYCPMDITAANVTYARSFKEGFSAVCLPFAVKGDDNITVSRFDKEAVGKIWFKKVSDEVPANTPLLIAAKNDFTFDLEGVTIKKTETQMVVDEGDLDEPSKGYGLFKTANREEFQGGATEPHKVYGLSGGVFKPVSETAVLPAFRMVVYSATAQPTGPSAAPRRIAIVDEMGNDITDELTSGIESVGADNDASSFSVIPSTGKIDITSEAELGNIAIYTIDGKLAAMTNVVAGTTTVELQQGIYIVMGKKVMVK